MVLVCRPELKGRVIQQIGSPFGKKKLNFYLTPFRWIKNMNTKTM